MKYVISQPVLDPAKVRVSGLSEQELGPYVPKYLYAPNPIECSRVGYFVLQLFSIFLITMTKLFLRPRKGEVGKLDRGEVEVVYNREAAGYDSKHHMTTRGKDTVWRRQAGWFVAGIARRLGRRPKVLDLCTGTGLTVEEMVKVLADNGLDAEITGLDYNEQMLAVARRRPNGKAHKGIKVSYARGDAMGLCKSTESMSNGLVRYPVESFDAITQMFGIGGIDGSVKVFESALRVLVPGGDYQVIDMHQPVANLPGEVPILGWWLRLPVFEHIAYNYHTLPVVLNRLWGWKDPTLDFYRLPVTTVQDGNGQWWGFETIRFETESQRWWLGLPIMPIAHIVVRKVEISEEEATKRQKLLAVLG